MFLPYEREVRRPSVAPCLSTARTAKIVKIVGSWTRIALVPLIASAAGCASIGPASVPRDRADYISAVAESWKQQTLLNLVRMRYGDAPSFVDVSSLISAYTFQGQLSASGQFSSQRTSTVPSSLGVVGGATTYTDRPTITYTPLAGDRFARSLLRPIPPSAIFELIQAGFPADTILQMTTRGLNGVYNRSTLGGETRQADPEFYAVLAAIRRLQLSGDVSLRVEKRSGEEVGVLLLSGRRNQATNQDLDLVLKTLRIKPGDDGQITLAFGALPRSQQEIAVLSRSMLGVLLEIASGIDVPDADIAAGRVSPSARRDDAPDVHDRPLIHIHSGPNAPAEAFAIVRYRDTSYWIRDDDLASKRVFTFLMMFFSLAETGVAAQAPIVTVPAN
jgi:hypothetical protein